MRTIWVSIFLLVFNFSAKTQLKFERPPESQITANALFDHFTSKDGLPDNRIRSIFQDSKGFIWFGTMNGLCKYDGYNFKQFYKTEDAASISGNWTCEIVEDKAQNLWIGTLDGLNLFNIKEETFTRFKSLPNNPNSLLSNRISTLCIDKVGKIWIGTELGLTTYNPHNGKFTSLTQYPFNTNICKIINSYDDFIWIIVKAGIVHYNIKNNTYSFYQPKIISNRYGDRYWSAYEVGKDLYIATTNNGLLKLKYDAGKKYYLPVEHLNSFANTKETLEKEEVFDVCRSRSGEFWIATGRGLGKIEHIGEPNATLNFYTNNASNNKSLSNNTVYKVFEDFNNNLWCGTEFGLNKLNLELLPFHYYTFKNPKSLCQVRSISTIDGNNIWLGTSISGIYNYNLSTGLTKKLQFSVQQSTFNFNFQRSIFIDKDNSIHVGTLGGSYIIKAGKVSNVPEEVGGAGVYAYLKDSKKNLWIGTNSGLYKINSKGENTKYLPDLKNTFSLNAKFVRSLYEDHNGFIWVGFDNGGLSYYDPTTDQFTNIVTNDGKKTITGKLIYAITGSTPNVLWVGSEAGLNRVDLELTAGHKYKLKIKTYDESNGLSDKCVNGILSDSKGYLWISTIKGLLRFNIAKEKFQNYLPALTFSFSCAHKYSENMLLFGTLDGFIIFDPQHISTNISPPNVIISDLKLFNKEVHIKDQFNAQTILSEAISETKEITFNYKNNVFTLGFTGLHYSDPEDNSYAYKMEGFDKDWITTKASNRSATYTNLDPGTYFFQVKASNSFGSWSKNPSVIKITILNPPWKSWWAITIYIFLLVGCFYLIFRYLSLQSRQRQKIKFEQMEKDHLKNLNDMKLEFFTDISHEFRTPLSLIVGPVEDLLLTGDTTGPVKQKLQLVHRNCNSLLYLLEELMTFQKMDQGMLKLKLKKANIAEFVKTVAENFEQYAIKQQITLTFYNKISALDTWFDPDKLEMVLNNLIFNAFKFTKTKGVITVTTVMDHLGPVQTTNRPVSNQASWFKIMIEDNGKGIPHDEIEHIFERFYQGESNKKGSGIGLSLSKSLIELHKGSIVVKSDPGVKTCFSIFLPIAKINQYNTSNDHKNDTDLTDVSLIFEDDYIQADSSLVGVMDNANKPDLLIVDDNPEVLDFLELIFKNTYNVTRAINGVAALNCIKLHEPALIISDVIMPEMDGITLCKIVKRQLNTFHIPFIILTAKSTTKNAVEGIEIGADDYIPKPFHPEFLKVRVEKLIENQKRIIEKFRSLSAIPELLPDNPMDEIFLGKITDCIKKHIDNDEFSVEELGSIIGMSRSNLFRKLKAVTGQTPIEFIYFIRLKYALDLLLERKLNVSEIAYEVGFKNPSSFSKSFKKQFGRSPTEYLNEIILANRH
jgi:signal transduction histidine kinase/ligand-binding sensor domain-containing protein/DNA-binding response OmpR family regulator